MKNNRIVLIGPGRHEEGLAAEAILPGALVSLNSSGQYALATNAGEAVERIVAVEDALQGKTVNDAYASGDWASFDIAQPGSERAVRLAGNNNVAIGARLKLSATAGEVDVAGADDVVIAVAREALDLTGKSAALLAVRFL